MLLQLPLLRPAASPILTARRQPRHRLRQSLGGDRWRKLADIDPGEVRQQLASWLLKTQNLLVEAAAPFVKPIQEGHRPGLDRQPEATTAPEELFVVSELTVERRTPNGRLSLAAVISIEQFGRMNGLMGRKMQWIFAALAPKNVRNDGRSLVEYCCFRYLSRDSSDLHPSLKVCTTALGLR